VRRRETKRVYPEISDALTTPPANATGHAFNAAIAGARLLQTRTLNANDPEDRPVIPERGWQCFATYHDELAATVVVDYLRRNDCPAQLAGRSGLLEGSVQVLVPGELLHRARWLWGQAELTESELQFLISGELPGGP
jgi:hypothetical protein